MNWNVSTDGRDAGIFYGNYKEAKAHGEALITKYDRVTLISENSSILRYGHYEVVLENEGVAASVLTTNNEDEAHSIFDEMARIIRKYNVAELSVAIRFTESGNTKVGRRFLLDDNA